MVFDANGNRSYPEVEKILTANGIYVTTKNNVYTQIDFIKQFTKRKKARVVLSGKTSTSNLDLIRMWVEDGKLKPYIEKTFSLTCLLYTSPSPRDRSLSRMPSSA